MKITRIKVYQVDLPLHEGSYKWSGGKSVEVFDSTVVALRPMPFTGHGSVSAGAATCRHGRRRTRGVGRIGPAPDRAESHSTGPINRLMDRPAGASVCEERVGYGVLGSIWTS